MGFFSDPPPAPEFCSTASSQGPNSARLFVVGSEQKKRWGCGREGGRVASGVRRDFVHQSLQSDFVQPLLTDHLCQHTPCMW
jgi:hypothetical protein